MNPRITGVKPLDNYCLELLFTNQERRLFDVKPYLSHWYFSGTTGYGLIQRY